MTAGSSIRAMAAALIVALSSVPVRAGQTAPADRQRSASPPLAHLAGGSPSAPADALTVETIRASARRWAAGQAFRVHASGAATLDERESQGAGTATVPRCRASWVEKLLFVYALVGGSIMVVTGPTEKEGDVWTADGKTEFFMGAGAVALSVALFRDIQKKGW